MTIKPTILLLTLAALALPLASGPASADRGDDRRDRRDSSEYRDENRDGWRSRGHKGHHGHHHHRQYYQPRVRYWSRPDHHHRPVHFGNGISIILGGTWD